MNIDRYVKNVIKVKGVQSVEVFLMITLLFQSGKDFRWSLCNLKVVMQLLDDTCFTWI